MHFSTVATLMEVWLFRTLARGIYGDTWREYSTACHLCRTFSQTVWDNSSRSFLLHSSYLRQLAACIRSWKNCFTIVGQQWKSLASEQDTI